MTRSRSAGRALVFGATLTLAACAVGPKAATSVQKAPAPLAQAPLAQAQKVLSGPVEIETSAGTLTLSVLTPGTVRLLLRRSKSARVWPSFAVEPALQASSAPYTREENQSSVLVRTAQLGVRVTKSPLHVELLDAAGRTVAEEAAPVAWQAAGFTERWKLAPQEQVYGLGDKAKGFNRRGQTFELWNTDAYGWKPDGDPLYKAIPFLLSVNEGHAHGLFIDTPARAQVDVGKAAPDVLSYTTEAGEALDFYLFEGPDPKQVLGAFTALTGRMPLPPLWALGYQQSRYSYLTEKEARDVVAHLRKDAIPLDVLWLDIDYQLHNAPFSVDPKAFPHFAGLIADLSQQGTRTAIITDPHIKSYQGKPLPSGYFPYDDGAANDEFLRDADPQRGFIVDKGWPGESVFPEFTLSRTRHWWGDLYRDFVAQGVAGFWNDMNEPAVFNDTHTLPVSVQHRFDDGSTLSHTAVHNAYGGLNARATYEGLLRLRPGERPFVLTRAAYAGTQRFAATWTGDNTASREHLALTIGQLANLGVSGYAFAGADVGGFVGCPDADLLVEWTELAAFQPFFRNHSMKDSCRREPWVHGPAVEARIRAAVERRYRLLPYLYSAFEETSRTGMPVLRPLWLEYPSDPSSPNNAAVFLVGRDLLVSPKLVAGRVGYSAELPHTDWWDTETETLVAGGGHVQIPASETSVRVYARAGAIIPTQPLVQTTAQTPTGALQLDVWPGAECSGSLYLDDGHSFAYVNGQARRLSFTCQVTANGISVSASSQGDYPVWWSSVLINVHGARPPRHEAVDSASKPLLTRYDAARHVASVQLTDPSVAWTTHLDF